MASAPMVSGSSGGMGADNHEAGRSRSRRILACVLCQQRKVKCDHNSPCATCVKARVPCIPTVQAKRRRRRQFSEKELLNRLHQYETLLKQHNISFDSLRTDPQAQTQTHENRDSSTHDAKTPIATDDEDFAESAVGSSASRVDTPGGLSGQAASGRGGSMLRIMRQEVRDFDREGSSDDEIQPSVFKKAWDETIESEDFLLFGGPHTTVALYTLHPQPLDIFRLWQIYLDNVNPLLKVTHTPSLQARILAAAGDILNIKPDLEALMFSIYCAAIFSLTETDCFAMFASPRSSLLAAYQMGCQQALVNSSFLRTTSRDCLTALYLYLISIRFRTTPESMSSMLSTAIRIAQRMGIHNESRLSKLAPLEAEMCRRLWWSLILFDTRIGEMADVHATSLLPIWDCNPPLNVNDSDLREDMTEHPQMQGIWTDTLFAVVRSELGNALRTARYHLDYWAPSLNLRSTETSSTSDSTTEETYLIERHFEDKYLSRCDPGNPLHFMVIWTTRGTIAKLRLMEHHFRYSGSWLHQAESQRAAAVSYALMMLKANTMIVTSPLTHRFRWMVYLYFPFVAYIQAVQYLKSQPSGPKAAEAWTTMSENYEANGELLEMPGRSRFFKILASVVLQAWDTHAAAVNGNPPSPDVPRIVLSMRQRMAAIAKQEMQPSQCVSGQGVPELQQSFENTAVNDGSALPEWGPYADMMDFQAATFPVGPYV